MFDLPFLRCSSYVHISPFWLLVVQLISACCPLAGQVNIMNVADNLAQVQSILCV